MISASNHRSITLILIVLLLLTSAIAALSLGPAQISLSQITAELFGLSPHDQQKWVTTIIYDIRLPRIIVAALAGGALALCGCVMQAIFRNPLASPSVLGVSSGASLGAVLSLSLGLASFSVWILPLFAFIGAGTTLFLVYLIASQRGQVTMGTLLLAGVAMAALNTALSSLILALSLSNWEVGQMILYWTMGGLEGRTWDHVLLLAPFTLLGSLFVLRYARSLDAMLLGELQASSVGVDVVAVRRDLLLLTAALVGAAIAVCGGIGFIGLVVPHILRLILGPQHRYLLPASVLGGALCLVAADLLLRLISPDNAIPLGVITASFGAPFFIYLLIRKRWSMAV